MEKCLAIIDEGLPYLESELRVLDLACGNLRFESLLRNTLPQAGIHYYAVDNCDDLLPQKSAAIFQNLDILDVLLNGQDLNEKLLAPPCELAVSFGFMHHIPSKEYREKILESLIKQVTPDGHIVVTFWQFLKDISLKTKALETHERALAELGLEELDENDFILDWDKLPNTYRYCHNYSDDEIHELAETIAGKANLVSRFISDGRTNTLNTYLVLKKSVSP